LIDRNCDATILAGASDVRLATKVLAYARGTRERLNIRPSDFDLGSMLHHDVPFLASVAGAPMSEDERSGNPHLSAGVTRDRSIAEAARHVMRSTAYAVGMPDNCLLTDPAKGNVAALLVDRVARLAGVSRVDEDGPRDALAAHVASASVRQGRGMTTEWTPGWPDAVDDPGADVRLYARRMFSLDDRQLAAELLEQVRDARTRLGVPDGPEPHAIAMWQTVPAMATLFGGRLQEGEASRFRETSRDMSDQQTFELASGLVAAASGDRSFLAGERVTIGDRALFADPAAGGTAAMLLDRVARDIGAERGGPGDPVGIAIAAASRIEGGRPSFSWNPAEPPHAANRMAIAARIHPGVSI
jgi:hypothetical protein